MPELFKIIGTVFLQVTDFDKSIVWYCTVLGVTVRWNEQMGTLH